MKSVGVFLEDRANEVKAKNNEAEKELVASQNPNRSLEDRQASRDRYLILKEEARETNNDWGAGGTYRQIATALTAGISGNVTGGTSQFAQNMVVNYLQQQGSAAIGDMVRDGLGEGSPEHAALHAILGCAGAAASRQSCSAGAMGGAASSLLTHLFSETSADESAPEREAKRNVIASLVTGIAGMTSPSTAATASNAAAANVDNNWLATQQELQYRKEYNEARTFREKFNVVVKWEGTSLNQDVLTGTSIAKGFTEGMAGMGLDTLNSAASVIRDPVESFDAVLEFAGSLEAQRLLGQQLAATLEKQVKDIQVALDEGGDEKAEALGKTIGQTYALVIGTIASGGGGNAAKSMNLSRIGINLSSKSVEALGAGVKLDHVKDEIAKLGKVGRDADVPVVEPVTTPGGAAGTVAKATDIDLPSHYRSDSTAGAMLARPPNIPDDYRVVVNLKTGNREVVSPTGEYFFVVDGDKLRPKDGGVLAGLKQAELEIAQAKNAGNKPSNTPLALPSPVFSVPNGYSLSKNLDGSATVIGPRGGVYNSTGRYSSEGKPIYRDDSGGYATLEGGRTAVNAPANYDSIPLHHVCTNKCTSSVNGQVAWTKEFQRFFDGADLNINRATENLVPVPGHREPPPSGVSQICIRDFGSGYERFDSGNPSL